MASSGLRLVVAGTGRCGTGYVAQLLDKAGVRAGHEQVFSPYGPLDEVLVDYDADSSWMSMPYLDEYRAKGAIIAGVYRHPQAVVSSLLGIEFFEHMSPYRAFAFLNTPGLTEKKTPFEQACMFYAYWNMRIMQYAHFMFNIDDPALDLLARGARVSMTSMAGAVPLVSQTYNHRQRADVAELEFPDYVWDSYQLLEDAARAS